jgi:cobalt/nickel transport system permease protein
MLPSWLQINGGWRYAPGTEPEAKNLRLHFLDRTLKALTGLVEEFILSDVYAHRPGLLQSLDARSKLLGILLLIVTVSLVHSIFLLFLLYAATLALATLSRIEPSFFIRRIWLVLTFFVGIIALPATLNVFTPGDPVWVLYATGREMQMGPYHIPAEIALTRQGIFSASLLVGRVATSMSLVLLLVLTTPWPALLKALRLVGIPRIYVQTLGMTLRYLAVLVQTVEEMILAKKSRTIHLKRTGTEQSWVAGRVGALFRRSIQLSGEVHLAMVARGYQGEVKILGGFRLRQRDFLWVGSCLVLAGFFICLGR